MRPALITILLVGLQFSLSLSAFDTQARLSQLQSLIDKNITGSIFVPADSVIQWGEKVNKQLLEENRYTEYFEIELLMINAFCSRGDITLALDRVKRMLNKAIKLNSNPGIAMAGVGIGDTYTYSNMVNEAIPSYEEALKLFKEQSNTKYINITLLKIVHSLLQEDQIEKALPYFDELNKVFIDNSDDPLYPVVLMYNAFYHIINNQLDDAKEYLTKAGELIAHEPQSIRTATLYFFAANYYEKKGDYTSAINELNKLVPDIEKRLDPARLADLVTTKARIYQKQGSTHEATLLYQQIIELKDSLYALSYSRQVNTLRTIYKVNQIDLENQSQRNKQISTLIIVSLILLVIIILFALYIIRSNKLLEKSREQLQKAKIQAENSAKSKSMILSNMSHEIRTPLNALTGFSAILTEEMIDNETRQQCNDIIQQNSELLMKLINDVIDLSSLEFGKMQFNFKEYDAVKICRNVADTVDKVKQTGAQILFKTDLETLVLDTDEARLQQVLLNLMINATKFTQEGQIALELSLESEEVAYFTVTDTGCGIPPEKQKRIFERFEKLDELAQGTGLGLSICQLIINHIGGKIWIDSSYTTGSRFCFTHPIHRSNKS